MEGQVIAQQVLRRRMVRECLCRVAGAKCLHQRRVKADDSDNLRFK